MRAFRSAGVHFVSPHVIFSRQARIIAMSAIVDERRTIRTLPEIISDPKLAARRFALMWRQHRHAALLKRIDAETRADIGYSRDYVRADWQSFAAAHPETIAPAAVARNGRLLPNFSGGAT
jgi:hypothetical protein